MWPKPARVSTHPEEQRDSGHLGSASDHTQAWVWAWFFVFLLGLLLTGIAFGSRGGL